MRTGTEARRSTICCRTLRRVRSGGGSEAEELGQDGRFGAGLPRVSDGSWLFVQHMVAHMRPSAEGGARAALLFPALALNRSGTGSDEAKPRQWLLRNDLLEGVVALPADLFVNTIIPCICGCFPTASCPDCAERSSRSMLGDTSRPCAGRRAVNGAT
uniref:N-6 DNA methylase n=1 Tax=Streptomyces sp. NRRL B-24051 TaxID=1463832 RepID=UPI002D21E0FF|nr:N-6 DNA methylase [Streptomyces sp. NRRL B-24051]